MATSSPGLSPRSEWWSERLPKFVRISSRKHDEMSSFCLNNGFRLQKTNRATRRWKQPPKKPFHHVSRDKILHDSWSISAALARGFSDRHFERGEGPGDEVVQSGQSRPQSPRAFTVSRIEVPRTLGNQKPDATFAASGFLKRMGGRF